MSIRHHCSTAEKMIGSRTSVGGGGKGEKKKKKFQTLLSLKIQVLKSEMGAFCMEKERGEKKAGTKKERRHRIE